MRATHFKLILLALVLIGESQPAAAAPPPELNLLIDALFDVAAAMAVLVVAIQGLKFVTSETPADREEAKKGLIYVLMGLLVVFLAVRIVCGIYCYAIEEYDYIPHGGGANDAVTIDCKDIEPCKRFF